jgi:hypothetical protein
MNSAAYLTFNYDRDALKRPALGFKVSAMKKL